jgi:hypothetical protein
MATLSRIATVLVYPAEWVRCRLLRFFRRFRGLPPSLECWLDDYPNVAASDLHVVVRYEPGQPRHQLW